MNRTHKLLCRTETQLYVLQQHTELCRRLPVDGMSNITNVPVTLKTMFRTHNSTFLQGHDNVTFTTS